MEDEADLNAFFAFLRKLDVIGPRKLFVEIFNLFKGTATLLCVCAAARWFTVANDQ